MSSLPATSNSSSSSSSTTSSSSSSSNVCQLQKQFDRPNATAMRTMLSAVRALYLFLPLGHHLILIPLLRPAPPVLLLSVAHTCIAYWTIKQSKACSGNNNALLLHSGYTLLLDYTFYQRYLFVKGISKQCLNWQGDYLTRLVMIKLCIYGIIPVVLEIFKVLKYQINRILVYTGHTTFVPFHAVYTKSCCLELDLHASVLFQWFWVCRCSHALVIKRPCATINCPTCICVPLHYYTIKAYIAYSNVPYSESYHYHPSRWCWSPLCVCNSWHCFVAGSHSTVIATYCQWGEEKLWKQHPYQLPTTYYHLSKVGASCRRLEHR